jgi:GH24 family phage-related lysozyme (muramidase)
MAIYLEQSTAQTTVFETAVPWMYLDTRGLVTAGIGQMLPDAASAQALAFLHPDGTPAHPDAIGADFDRVRALAPGHPCHVYRSPTSPTLPTEAMTSLLTAVTTANDAALRHRLPDYDAFPTPAKLALLDMLYNLGEPKLFGEYPLLLAAVHNQHWLLASQQCHRTGPNPARNLWTRDQFLAAATP